MKESLNETTELMDAAEAKVLPQMMRWVRFDEHDAAVLREAWPAIAPHLDDVATRFYDRILEDAEARAVLADEAQVRRLQATLKVWCRDLVLGPHDHAWYERQRRVGQVHVAVALPHRFMFTAMTVLADQLCDIVVGPAMTSSADPRRALAACTAIRRVTQLALATMTGTYMHTRERRQLATLQELLVSHLPVAVLVVGHDDTVTVSTLPAARMFSVGAVDGRRWEDVLPAALVEAADLHARIHNALRSDHDVSLMRVDAEIDGRTRSFRIDIVPLKHRIASFLLHVEDLTSTVEAEVRLRRAEQLAQLGELSAAVAHELRNPLAGISGALQVLSRSFDADDRRASVMGSVVRQVTRLDDLVTDLLAFARPRPPRNVDLPLRSAAEEVVRLAQAAWPAHRFEVAGDGVAWADGDHLHRILLNLVTNAAQATPAGATVRLELADGLVRVQDDGPGVPPEVAPRIFEPFFTTRTTGTGLGLAICAQGADAMGGSLTLLDQRPGATFELRMLRAEPAMGWR